MATEPKPRVLKEDVAKKYRMVGGVAAGPTILQIPTATVKNELGEDVKVYCSQNGKTYKLSLEELKNHENLDIYIKEIMDLGLIK